MTTDAPQRHSIAYFPSGEGRLPAQGEAFLLARDIQQGIMPMARRAELDLKVELTPPSDDGAAWLANFINIGQHQRHYLQEAVVDFVDTSANYLGYFGEVVFEIIDDEKGQPFELDPLPPGRVLRTPRSYLQVIPKPDRERLNGRRFASIPSEKVWRLTLPPELGSPRTHRRLLRRLGMLAPHPPPFAFQTMDLGASAGYDFSVYLLACQRLQEKELNRWGTVPSEQRPIGPSTEYFYIARRLAFHHSQALVREHAIAELNALVGRLGVGHSVSVAGVPTAAHIADVLGRMHKGEISLSDALKATSI